MKYFFLMFAITLLLITVSFSSCSSNNDIENQESSPTQASSLLEGNWLLQNIPNGAKLNFSNNNFTINSGSVIIKGTFTFTGNQMSGKVISRSGVNNEGLQPETFTGNVAILNNRVTFTDFTGNWRAVFSTWYGKQQ